MDTESISTDIYRTLRSDPENLNCFDCGCIDIKYFSLNLGITLCCHCASAHNSLIPEITLLKSLSETFYPREIKFLNSGGNTALKIFLAMYSIPCNDSIEYKYRTVACQYYREMLQSLATGNPCPMLTPSESEGLMELSELPLVRSTKSTACRIIEDEENDTHEISRKSESFKYTRRTETSKSSGIFSRAYNETVSAVDSGVQFFKQKFSKEYH